MSNIAGKRLDAKRRNILYACVLLAYVLFNLSFILCHESWRDEAQAWLLARDLSIPELFEQMSYEGHPCLWHLLLMPLVRLGLPYISMNILSLLIMAAAAALLLWKAPLPLPVKILALFGCAFSYYYPVVSRSYCLIPLFAFMMAHFYRTRREKPAWYGLSIALMVQTHVIMLGMAGAASLVWLAEAIAGYRRDRDRRALLLQGGGLLLPLLSFVLLLLQISAPQASTAYHFSMDKLLSLPGRVLSAARKLLSILPAPLNILAVALAALFCLWALIRAVRKRESTLLKAFVVVALAVAFQFAVHVLIRPSSGVRTLSIFFIVLWFAWVSWPDIKDVWLRRLLALALVAMELVTYFLCPRVFNEYRYPYSDAVNCAAFIRETLPEDTIFLEVNEARASALLPYLSEDYVFYSPRDGEPVSFASWDREHYAQTELSDYESIRDWALALDPDCESVCLIVTETDDAFEEQLIAALEPYTADAEPLYRSPDAPMFTDERYTLYAIPIT